MFAGWFVPKEAARELLQVFSKAFPRTGRPGLSPYYIP
jgi:hypothetical protein